MIKRLPYIWDYDIDEEMLKRILAGNLTVGSLNKKWATVRLLEYAPYNETIKLLGYKEIYKVWSIVRNQIRSKSRKRGFDFLIEWLKNKHPERI